MREAVGSNFRHGDVAVVCRGESDEARVIVEAGVGVLIPAVDSSPEGLTV